MNMATMERFKSIINRHTGLVIPDHDLPSLEVILDERIRVLKLSGADFYFLLLDGETADSIQEWRLLVLRLTTGESYFFRDSGQFNLLESRILPELLRLHRHDRTLRIWSAGCSTGEEPYSLAIALDRLIPPEETWQLLVLGTDINDRSLEIAREGRYGEWSFRRMDPEVISRYFHRKKRHGPGRDNEWHLDRRIREMVTFRHVNLIKETFPSSDNGLERMDLILCRNVFIYFNTETIAILMRQFAQSLTNDGYLMTGHAESVGAQSEDLTVRVFPESMIYQKKIPVAVPVFKSARKTQNHDGTTPANRREGSQSAGPWRNPLPRNGARTAISRLTGYGASTRLPMPPAVAVAPPVVAEVEKAGLANAESAFLLGDYPKAIALAKVVAAHATASGNVVGSRLFAALMLLARANANLGHAPQADAYCRQAMQADPLSPSPHYLLAHLMQDKGEIHIAVEYLNKAIYLDADYIPAYLGLGEIYRQLGDEVRAGKMWQNAMDLLRAKNPDSRVETYEEWTVADLLRHLESMRQ